MYNFLTDHAIKNVWCVPDQDRQLIIEPAKITPFDGVWNNVIVFNRSIALPIQATRFHVYQIGQLYPGLMGLPSSDSVWTSMNEACNKANLIVDIYVNSGLQLPRFQTWYMVTSDGNLIVAVKDQPTIHVDLNVDPLFIRVYTNAYFASSRSDPLNDFIQSNGAVVKTTADILSLQNQFNAVASLPGVAYAFVNGYKVAGIDLITVVPGDVAEYVYDSSVYEVVDLKFSDMSTFNSTLDSKRKYLLHYAADSDISIEYHDDIDFFIIGTTSVNRHKGIYYHRNSADAIRMVTHKDYSLVVPYAAGYVNSVLGWTDITALTLRMHIRKSSYLRNLVYENNRIEELYKLADADVVSAMVGINATVPSWTAANLENSAYTKLMGSEYAAINLQTVQDAYGYNLISKLLGDTPAFTDSSSGTTIANLPYGLVSKSVAYEYDSNGLMIGWHQHQNGTAYVATSPSAAQVEAITGITDPSFILDEIYGEITSNLDPTLDYRFYTCPIFNGNPTNNWTDVTGSTKYLIRNNKVTWNIDPTLTFTLVRSNKNILAYDLLLLADNGLLKFSLAHSRNYAGNLAVSVMSIPMGELDLFLNGYSLIEGIDYIVNFPEIVIINKAYLVNVHTDSQKVTVRFTGFCNSDLTRNTQSDVGFVKYGLLSRNNRFDIRDDKVLRIVVGGKLYNRSMLKFSELDSGVTVSNIVNGLPYSIKDIVVPLRGSAVDDTYTCRSRSLVIDKSISDYMTSKVSEAVHISPNVIPSLYAVSSPFCSKIIYDLQTGVLNDIRINGHVDDATVLDICKSYEYLLKYDISQNGLKQDSSYVSIHPHNLLTAIPLNIIKYKFIDSVVRLYMNGLVNINGFISIS